MKTYEVKAYTKSGTYTVTREAPNAREAIRLAKEELREMAFGRIIRIVADLY